MPTERITFAGHNGDQLAARLDLPDGPVLGAALMAHCFTCSKDIPAARRIAQRLSAEGLAVLRFDFTGLGHSKGEFSNTNFSSNVEDLRLAAQWMTEKGHAPGLLLGHSLGGAAVLRAAPDLPSIKAVVTVGAPFEPGHVTHNFGGALDKIRAEGRAVVDLGGRPFEITREFVENVEAERLEDCLKRMKAALLVMHAPRDNIVGIENAANIFTHAKHPKSFVTLDDADHLVTNGADAEYAAGVIAAWSQRYLNIVQPEPPESAPEGIVRISESDPQGFLQDISTGPHQLLADEPASVGGTNRGLTPYNLVAAGLGACTSMTIRLYARSKGIDLHHVSVDVSHDKVHAQAAAGDNTKVDTFRREIVLEGDLNDSERAKLLQIAEKCPVHRTLERTSTVETVLASKQ